MIIRKWISSDRDSKWVSNDVGVGTASVDTLDLAGERLQTMAGFGGCFNELGWIALQNLDEARRVRVLDELFLDDDGCRFNICRIPIGASDYADEWYSHNETPDDYGMEHFSVARDRKYLLPYIKEALGRKPDLTLFASPWSPPTWMKDPKAYNYGTLVWTGENLRAYALYFARFVEEYAKEGVTIHQLHTQNEPVADQKFPSCVWTGAQMRDFIKGYLAPVLKERGLAPEIWLGTINSDDYNGFANTVLSDPDARALIAGVGYQWAGKGALYRTRDSYPEARLMQTENECGDGGNTWGYATYVFDLMRHYLLGGVEAYIYWNMVLAPGGRSTWGWFQNSMITVDPATGTAIRNPEYYVMKHFSGFVRPGSRLLATKGHWSGTSVAFETPDGGLVAIVHNPHGEARSITLRGVDGEATVTLAPDSLNTFAIG